MGLIKFLLLKFRELTKNTNLQMSQDSRPAEPERRIVPRDKAIAVAETVSVTEDGEVNRVYCPVCSNMLLSSVASDVKMLLALHLSVWHPDDVNLRWEIMQNEGKSKIHELFSPLDVGIAAAFGALLVASLWKIHSQSLIDKRRRR